MPERTDMERNALELQSFENNVDQLIAQLRQLLQDINEHPENIVKIIGDIKKKEELIKAYRSAHEWGAKRHNSQIFSLKGILWMNEWIPAVQVGIHTVNLFNQGNMIFPVLSAASLVGVSAYYRFLFPQLIRTLNTEIERKKQKQEHCFKMLEIVQNRQPQLDEIYRQISERLGLKILEPSFANYKEVSEIDEESHNTTRLRP